MGDLPSIAKELKIKGKRRNVDQRNLCWKRPLDSLSNLSLISASRGVAKAFTGTKDEETGEKDPLSVQLVGICSQTKYCMVVAAPAKRSMLKEATQEICRGLMFLGVPEVTLRRDTGPATKQLSDASKLTRKDLA